MLQPESRTLREFTDMPALKCADRTPYPGRRLAVSYSHANGKWIVNASLYGSYLDWGNLGPLLLAGGGLPAGVVIGQSSSNGGDPATEPVRVPNLIGTVMHTLFDTGKLRVTRGVSREVMQMADYAPIRGLNG